MLLKYFLMLLSLGVFFSDRTGGAGGDDDGGDDDSGDDGAGGEGGGDDDDSSDDDDGDDDRAELREALQKERKARRDAVKAQKALQRELDALKQGRGDDGDDDKVTAAEQRAEQAERRLREATGRTAVMDAANDANAIDLDVVYAMVRDELEYDDEGEPTNVEDVLEDLQERKPKLFRHSKGRGDGSAGGDTKPEIQPGVARIRAAYEENAKKQTAGRR